MFQLHFADLGRRARAPRVPRAGAGGPAAPDPASVLLLRWEEHCTECAVPECYTSCPLYRRRRDGACARFAWGIAPNPGFPGDLPFGADVAFRRFAKLEARLDLAFPVSPLLHRALQRADSLAGRVAFLLADFLSRNPRLLAFLRRDMRLDEFVLECHAPRGAEFYLIIEYFTLNNKRRETVFRHGFPIRPGRNLHRLPAEVFRLGETGCAGYLNLCPENVLEEKRLVFSRLGFVRLRGETAAGPAATVPPPHAEKVKCVAWDLDGTFWDGVLTESNPDRLAPRPGVLDLVRALDARGILQTAASKNEEAAAMAALGRLGVADFFLHPAIHWGQKSESLKRIASALNLGLDSFALIDDSPFERAEVARALPQVRLYREDEIAGLIARPEFDVPVTEEARRRRESYRTEARRAEHSVAFSGDYLGFLRSCDLRLRVFRPSGGREAARCLELLRRSNQLNLRTRRYDEAEFAALLSDPARECYALACRDRFGDYGIVGFASSEPGEEGPRLVDLVLSCRIARKRVEHAFLAWLARRAASAGARFLETEFVPTDRNGPLRDVFADLPFETAGRADAGERMRWPLARPHDVAEPVLLEDAP